MTTPSTDTQLISRIKSGDRAAFGDLVGKYQNHLLRFLARRLPDRSDAEDVAQETLIRAYCAIDDFREDAKFPTWLFRIGLNMATDFQAIEARRRAVASGATGRWGIPLYWVEEHGNADSPEELLSARQLGQRLAAAIAGLTPDLSKVLVMREFEGLSYAEIAHALHCPVTTVRSRLARARDILAIAVSADADRIVQH
jgi:RNA polymerase sigma-70 factor (ECF subfamily)